MLLSSGLHIKQIHPRYCVVDLVTGFLPKHSDH